MNTGGREQEEEEVKPLMSPVPSQVAIRKPVQAEGEEYNAKQTLELISTLSL